MTQKLTLNSPIITAAADDISNFVLYVSEKIIHQNACESSARQTIHMKHKALFFLKKII